MRLKLSFGLMSLIAVYTSTNVCKLDVKDIFYAKLASVADSCPRRDIHIVLGDFNVVSGGDRAAYEMSVGPYGSGADTGSENSLLFRDFARSQKLRISGSWYHSQTHIAGHGTVMQEMQPRRSTTYSLALVGRSSRIAGFIGVLSSLVLIIDWLWLPSESTSILPSGQMITLGCFIWTG